MRNTFGVLKVTTSSICPYDLDEPSRPSTGMKCHLTQASNRHGRVMQNRQAR